MRTLRTRFTVSVKLRRMSSQITAEREGRKQRISEMKQFLDEQTREITEYDDQLVRKLIEKITVYDERVAVEFKSGASVEVRR